MNRFVLNFLSFVVVPLTLLAWYFYPEPVFEAVAHKKTVYLLFLFLAGASDACKDTLAHHFSLSIFNRLNKRYWDASESWKNKYINFNHGNPRRTIWILGNDTSIPIPVVCTDGWHLFKAFQTIFICLSVVFFYTTGNIALDIALTYGFYKWGFSVFYSIILIKDKI